MRGRDYRRRMAVKNERRLMKIITDYRRLPRAGYVEHGWVNGEWQAIGEYIKYPKNSNMKKYFKKLTTRKVRHSETFANGNSYRKCMEYRWNFW